MAGLSKNSPDVFTNFSQFEQLKKKKKLSICPNQFFFLHLAVETDIIIDIKVSFFVQCKKINHTPKF